MHNFLILFKNKQNSIELPIIVWFKRKYYFSTSVLNAQYIFCNWLISIKTFIKDDIFIFLYGLIGFLSYKKKVSGKYFIFI